MSVRTNSSICRWHQNAAANGTVDAVARGSCFLGEQYFNGEELARHVVQRAAAAAVDRRFEVLRELAEKLNGSWAFVVQWADGEMVAAVDRLRSIPLFYGYAADGELVVANDVMDLADCRSADDLDDEAVIEFLLAGYIIGSRTLRKGISQFQAGEMLHWKDNELHQSRYYRFLRSGWITDGKEKMMDQLGEVMDRVFSRYARQFSDRRIFVPLSDGLDSRLILAMLKRHGHRDLVAFHYGRPGNKESIISKSVAEALGVPWEGIPYMEGNWHPLMASEKMRDYWHHAGQSASLPHVQDYLALHILRQKDPRLDAVFFPGVAGDMIAGVWVPDHYLDNEGQLNIEEVSRWIYYRKYILWPSRRRDRRIIIDRIKRFLDEAPFTEVHNSAAAFDLFEFENRQSKYIVNSVRTFEAHGFDWQLPLCANELMDFYLTVPTELRELKRLCALWTRDRLFVGSMSPLAEIELGGDGRCVWYGEPRPIRHDIRGRTSRLLQSLLKHYVLSRIAKWRLSSGFMQHTKEPLRLYEWFVPNENASLTQTLGDVMAERSDVYKDLPPVAAAYASNYRHYPVCLIRFLGMLALAYLADVNRSP